MKEKMQLETISTARCLTQSMTVVEN